MSTISRPLNPGENPSARGGTQNERQFLNRIYLGQVRSVDSDNGTILVLIFGLGQENLVHIPLQGMSVNRTQSSWIRYMPQAGDFVKVGFGPDNYPEILGYALYGIDPADSTTTGNAGAFLPRTTGYKQLRRLKERSDAGERPLDKNGNPITLGFRDFIPLRPGEWDLRSTGGAYIHGSQFGVLTLSGGTNSFKIDKTKDEIDGETRLFKLDAGDDTFIRLGDIKREIHPTDLRETTISEVIPFGAGTVVSTREYRLKISRTLSISANPLLGPEAVTVPAYDEKIGDVRNDLTLLPDPIPLVVSRTAYNPTGVPIHTFNVSTIGDTTISSIGSISLAGGPVGLAPFTVVRAETLNTWLTTQLSVMTAFGPSGPAVAPLPGVSLLPGLVNSAFVKVS